MTINIATQYMPSLYLRLKKRKVFKIVKGGYPFDFLKLQFAAK